MEKVYRGVQRLIVETDDWENISQVVLNDLEIGDIIAIVDEGTKKRYTLVYKEQTEMYFVYTDSGIVKEVYFSYNTGTKKWGYVETFETELGGEDKSGLEVIEWNGERKFTKEEIDKLVQMKACVKDDNDFCFIVGWCDNAQIDLPCFSSILISLPKAFSI